MEKMKKITLAALIILLAGAAGLLLMRKDKKPTSPELTRETALEVLKDEVSDCEEAGVEERYRSCTMTVVKVGDGYVVTITHDGFFDDSVKASRIEAVLAWTGRAWTIVSVTETQQCWPNRGHQDFSSELCV